MNSAAECLCCATKLFIMDAKRKTETGISQRELILFMISA